MQNDGESKVGITLGNEPNAKLKIPECFSSRESK